MHRNHSYSRSYDEHFNNELSKSYNHFKSTAFNNSFNLNPNFIKQSKESKNIKILTLSVFGCIFIILLNYVYKFYTEN